jgi:Xaa-Pro aminopeptidase
MVRDQERVERVVKGMRAGRLDALVCALPIHVLLLTGYWPVVGVSLAVVFADGETIIIAPEDESWLARNSWADRVITFQPASLDRLQSTAEAVLPSLQQAVRDHPVSRVGYEQGEEVEPSSYAAMYLYGGGLRGLVGQVLPEAQLHSADSLLAGWTAVKTPAEVARIRLTCAIAAEAFARGSQAVRMGAAESEIANAFRAPLSEAALARAQVQRADGFVSCMSGPNSAKAAAAYAHSSARRVEPGDIVLVHCNSYVDGFWTDITRTYCLGEPDSGRRRMYEAVATARANALQAIGPGVAARVVDEAARRTLALFDFTREFKHATGHGVGFAAIGHNARPRIHPHSDEVLEPGMVFNLEPAVYIDGVAGVRHCDMVAVTESGCEVLTPFQLAFRDLVRDPPSHSRQVA